MNRRLCLVFASLALLGSAKALEALFPDVLTALMGGQHFVADVNARPSALQKKAASQRSAYDLKPAARETVILALSWTAAFCETKPQKRECKTQTSTRYDARNFALHGLWPKPHHCNKTPYEKVSHTLWQAMQRAMPGVKSGLHRHEWEKHGTCYASTAQRYFEDAIRLTLAFNQTHMQALFADNQGKYLSNKVIRAAFDKTFGEGAGARVLVHCAPDGNRRLVQELRLALKGDLQSANFATLLKQADPQKPGCSGGLVDKVGLQ